jgi:Zn-dependent protease with chaperone function
MGWIYSAMMDKLEAMETIKYFPEISSRSWEHPADRAALNAFRAIPGADILIRKFIGMTNEKSLRLLMLASAARVTEKQFATVNKLTTRVCEIFDVKDRPEVYVSQSPIFNAGAYGVDRPFIVLNSAIVGMLDEKELTYVIGHEMGHILSGHALYKTVLWYILQAINYMGLSLPMVAALALIAALKEWDRKSELSSDRAGLLAIQNDSSTYTALMKSAGGGKIEEMDINEFFKQAAEYDAAGDTLDSVYKFLNTVWETHPFPVVRLAELKTWEKSGYQDILNGNYARKGSEGADFSKDFQDATKQYKDDFQSSKDPLAGFAKNVAAGAEDLFRNADKTRQQVEDFFNGLFNK